MNEFIDTYPSKFKNLEGVQPKILDYLDEYFENTEQYMNYYK